MSRISYKSKWLEAEKEIRNLKHNRIDLTKEATEFRVKNNIPILLHKWRFRIEEQDDVYLLFDVPNAENPKHIKHI